VVYWNLKEGFKLPARFNTLTEYQQCMGGRSLPRKPGWSSTVPLGIQSKMIGGQSLKVGNFEHLIAEAITAKNGYNTMSDIVMQNIGYKITDWIVNN